MVHPPGSGTPDGETTAPSGRLKPQKIDAGWSWLSSEVFELSGERPWLDVLVEDLASGRWGTRLIELSDGASADREGLRQWLAAKSQARMAA